MERDQNPTDISSQEPFEQWTKRRNLAEWSIEDSVDTLRKSTREVWRDDAAGFDAVIDTFFRDGESGVERLLSNPDDTLPLASALDQAEVRALMDHIIPSLSRLLLAQEDFDQSTRKLRQLAAEKPRIAEAFEARMSRGEQPGWYAALVHELNSYGAKSDRAEPKTLTQKIASDLGVDQALPNAESVRYRMR